MWHKVGRRVTYKRASRIFIFIYSGRPGTTWNLYAQLCRLGCSTSSGREVPTASPVLPVRQANRRQSFAMAQRTAIALTGADEDARRFWPLTLGAIGVVYGDIGTSPIYAFREAVVAAAGGAAIVPDTVFGILSLILWSLFLLVTLKYVCILLRADFNGEGGTFALMALAQSVARRSSHIILLLGIAGASFLYGDAAITPALSVISAVEGLKVITPALEKAVVPLSLLILIGLFAMQSRGTARVAS